MSETETKVEMTNNKLYIGNLAPTVNEDSLRDLLKDKSGSVPTSVLVKRGGYAFVECKDPAAAEKAIESLNGFSFMGTELLVEPSVPQNKRMFNLEESKFQLFGANCDHNGKPPVLLNKRTNG
ncbi:hypothetical protein JTE90_001082 [Oedothorax gibbosus]|uniref:RRM domain-containing protein n=1 Tax=Oedothorax gibbosus TaxID=931172 RepID=A0AAV6UKC8_9ARAC|nr:hypothetical protein JTE90_001082 [Oedothorax gibbosus]